MEAVVNSSSLNDLKKQADELLKGIQTVDDDIKKVTGIDYESHRAIISQRNVRKRIRAQDGILSKFDKSSDINKVTTVFGSGGDAAINIDSTNSQKRRITIDDLPEGDRKRHKLSSSIVVAPESGQEGEKLFSQSETEVGRQNITMDPETMNRSKRIFGILRGTLNKFKVENEQSKHQIEKRRELEDKIKAQSTKEQEEAKQKRMELFRDRRDKQRKLRLIEEQMEAADLQEKLVLHYEFLKNYIKLDSDPALFYKPSKHNDLTKLKQEISAKTLEETLFEVVKEIMTRSMKNSDEMLNNTHHMSEQDAGLTVSNGIEVKRKKKIDRLGDGIDPEDSSSLLTTDPDDEDKAAAEVMLRNAAKEFEAENEVI